MTGKVKCKRISSHCTTQSRSAAVATTAVATTPAVACTPAVQPPWSKRGCQLVNLFYSFKTWGDATCKREPVASARVTFAPLPV